MTDGADGPVELYRARGPAEAHALRIQLEEAGIAVHIDNELLQGIVGEVPGGWVTAPTLLVNAGQFDRAQALLDQFLARAHSAPEDTANLHCLACQAPMGDAVVCPACGWTYEPEPEPSVEGRESPVATGPDPETPFVPRPPAPAAGNNETGPTGLAQWQEVIAVMAVGVFPNLFSAIQGFFQSSRSPPPYWADSLCLAGIGLCTIYVVQYILRRNGEQLIRFGVDRPRFTDIPLGIGMLVVAMFVFLVEARLGTLGDSGSRYFAPPRTESDYAWMVVALGIAAYSEELVTRGYLITRLEGLLRSRGWAVLVSAVLFASYHIYQGFGGAFGALLFGLAFGVAYLGIRRVWPLAIGHALYNMVWESTS